MMLLITLFYLISPLLGAKQCPEYGDWKPWTEQCLWYPLTSMHQKMTSACGIQLFRNLSAIAPSVRGLVIPERCGHCSFKFRCRTREPHEGCFRFNGESKTCEEYGDVCTIPRHPQLGCKWKMYKEALEQCLARPDLSDWTKKGYRKLFEAIPEGHCVEKDGQCKCCCGKYHPSEDGTKCVKMPEAKCDQWRQPNEWSGCMWFPLAAITKGFETHCDIQGKGHGIHFNLPTPSGLSIPDKCGFCSYRIRCQQREGKEGCFPLKIEKKACGADDCPTCGNICTVQAYNGSCDWMSQLEVAIWKQLHMKAKQMEMPFWRFNGYANVVKYLPHGVCKNINGQCKCCCHPYMPNAEGTACVLQDYCKTMSEVQS